MTVILDLSPDLEARLRDRATAQGVDPAAYAVEVLNDALGRAGAATREGELLRRLDLGLSPEAWARYRSLVTKRRDESISEPELTELISLTDQIESANARRLEAVTELSRLRGKSLQETFDELGLGPVGGPYDE
jgi:hypothetical protein